MNNNFSWKTGIAVALLLTMGLGVWIWSSRPPTMEMRDNRKAVDAILTAITMKNKRLLEAGIQRAQERRQAAQLTEDQFAGMLAFASKARSGDWSGAEKDGYAFRQKYPFVKEGQ
jgi:hypothetical protein